jgi:uncharacterized integral membrane protein
MLKSSVVFMVVLLIVLFSISNIHHIDLHFITREPFEVRLIYLVLFSYVMGLVTAAYFVLVRNLAAKRKKKAQTELFELEEEKEKVDW